MTQTQGVYTLMLFGFITNLISNIPWSIIFLFTPYFGIHLYNIKKREDCLTIQKNIGSCTHITDGGKGYGYSMGYWYIAYIENTGDNSDPSVSMICTKGSYNMLTKSRDIIVKFSNETIVDTGNPIKVLERFGLSGNCYYRSRNLKICVQPRPPQQVILDSVKDILKQKKSAIVLIHGPPNVGKTMISLIIANDLKGIYCSSMAPWEPGDSLANLYTDAEPTESSPLIVAFDEIDGPLQRIHEGIPDHKNLRTKVKDKQGWNQMLDEIQMGFYPHLVIILTTNKNPEFINAMDPSYIREHRVDKIFELC
jgi:hypothetical protein